MKFNLMDHTGNEKRNTINASLKWKMNIHTFKINLKKLELNVSEIESRQINKKEN